LTGKNFKSIGFIFLLAFALRLSFVLFFHESSSINSDSLNYFGVAQGLVDRGGFYSPVSGEPSRGEPLYPLFLAAFILYDGDSFMPVMAGQAFLGSLTCMLLYVLFNKIFFHRAALLAGTILAVHPVFIQQSARLLTEILFTCLLVILFILLIRAAERNSRFLFLCTGLTAGLAILTRDIALYLPVFLFIALFYVMERKKAALFGCILISVVLVATVSPWVIRNYTLTEDGPVIAHDIATRYWTDPEAGFFGDSSANILTTLKFLPFRLKHLIGHPYGLENLGGNIRYRLTLWIFNGLNPEHLIHLLKDWRFWYRGCVVFLHYFLILMAFIGLILGFKERKKAAPLYLLFFYFTAAILATIHVPPPRFLYPLLPFLIGFSAAGLLHVRNFQARGRALRSDGPYEEE